MWNWGHSGRRQVKSKRKFVGRSGLTNSGPFGGRFYFFTIAYGLFYLIGGFVGFARKRSLLCLGVSCGIGLTLLLLGFAHLIEYNRGVPIESIYVAWPLFVSFGVGISLTVVYSISGDHINFVPFGLVGTAGCVATSVYTALFARDFARNKNFSSYNTYNQIGNKRDDPFLPGSRDPLL